MNDGLKPYPEYKDTCVPWLGRVPEHWRVRSLGSLTRRVSKRNEPTLPLLSVVRERGVVLRASMSEEENHNYVPDDLGNYQVVRKGNLVVNKMKAWQGSLGVSPSDGVVSPAYFVFEFLMANGEFGHRLLRSKPYIAFFAQASDGVRIGQWDLSANVAKRVPVVVPSSEEQCAIVRFLDHFDRRINRLIRIKRRMIDLLKEQKRAIIQHAVTRGLDPNVRLKPSGVEWLGDIPEHWEVWKIGHFAKVGNGSTPARGNAAYWSDGSFPWLNSACVNQGVVMKADQFVTGVALCECHLPLVPPGSVLVAITGQGKTRGTAALLAIESTINQHLAYIYPRSKRVLPGYLQMFLDAAYPSLRAMSDDSGSTKGALTCQDLKHLKVALPPTNEQEELVSVVKALTRQTGEAAERANSELGLLREYRIRLIADVVTGKLDVREAAAQLPDEPEFEQNEEIPEDESEETGGQEDSPDADE